MVVNQFNHPSTEEEERMANKSGRGNGRGNNNGQFFGGQST